MSAMTNSRIINRSEADRAVASLQRAIGRLVDLLGDEDQAATRVAGQALKALGATAVVGPLAVALAAAGTPRHRRSIAGVLFSFREQEKAAVVLALTAAMTRERDSGLAILLKALLSAACMPDPIPSRPSSRLVRRPGSPVDSATPQAEVR